MAKVKSKSTRGVYEKESYFKIREGTPLPLGVRLVDKSVYFSVSVPNGEECKLNIYGKDSKELIESIRLEQKMGNLFYLAIDNLDYHLYEYMYEVEGKEFIDPYARIISGKEHWGKAIDLAEQKQIRGGFYFSEYQWEEDRPLRTNYEDLIIYRIHTRGFTKDTSSKVKNKGTFRGIIEKIPYLTDLGITAIELLPSYEFDEIIKEIINPHGALDHQKINYWGYTGQSNYFVPKSSYAANTANPIDEFKDLVKALHKAGIEIIMEFYFEPGINEQFIIDCLRHWVMEFHIDGIKINQNAISPKLIATDPFLSETKIFGLSWNTDEIYPKEFVPKFKNLAEYNDGFLTDGRRFLKSDEEQVGKVADRFKRNPQKAASINYITNTNGFTLMDLYSYDVKHNEDNGEKGRDGTDYNYGWNCGVEGNTRKKKVLELRMKQIKNAFLLLILSQGVPLILGGDEFGNSQKGNNNAYCQDNSISWLNWKLVDTNKEIHEFVKLLIQIRKDHPILHWKEELKNMDYASCGFPDLSFHGTKAWYPDYTNYSRMLGIMLCGRYAMIDRVHHDDDFYLAFNMHWEDHEFDLPKLPKGANWYIFLNTSDNEIFNYDFTKKSQNILKDQRKYMVKARSAVVLIGK